MTILEAIDHCARIGGLIAFLAVLPVTVVLVVRYRRQRAQDIALARVAWMLDANSSGFVSLKK